MLTRKQPRQKMRADRIVILPADELPRHAPKSRAYEELKKLIHKHGLLVPVFVNSKCVCVSGHIRLLACLELGIAKVPIVVAETLEEVALWFSGKLMEVV